MEVRESGSIRSYKFSVRNAIFNLFYYKYLILIFRQKILLLINLLKKRAFNSQAYTFTGFGHPDFKVNIASVVIKLVFQQEI
jgi:hypothetical protein